MQRPPYSGVVIRSIYINDLEVSEYLLNTYVAGHHNKPVVLVTGDETFRIRD